MDTLEVAVIQPESKESHAVHEVKMQCDTRVPMRDVITLSTDLFMPDVDYPVPVILVRTPYGNNSESEVEKAFYFASCGYAVAVQDVRGRYDFYVDW